MVRRPSLLADAAGAALVEFAIIMPVLLMLIFGTMEFGLNVYMRSVLEGAMQQAGRNSSLQTAQAGQTAIDTVVADRVKAILPGASVTFARKNYASFTAAGKPEDIIDSNGDGVLATPPDCFLDANANGLWDDGSRAGIGGANDVVAYTATVTYASLIPAAASLGISPTTTIKATTTLRNQPFASQPGWTTTRVCP